MRHGTLTIEAAQAIKTLRERITECKIPSSSLDEYLNIATWNIREFGKKRRKKTAIHLIAEILSQFDLIAVTELRDNLSDLKAVLDILGPYWHVVYSDFRDDAAGNHERTAFVYDKRMISFTGLAAEANPPRKRKSKGGPYETEFDDWWRSPYMASFRAGNFDFIVMACHMRWGQSEDERATALGHLAEWVHKRSKNKNIADKDIILLGDFNVPSTSHKTYQELTKRGLRAPDALIPAPNTNLSERNCYDQILVYPTNLKRFTQRGGVLNFYRNDHAALMPGLSLQEFTFQLSDHLPLWVQIDTWIEDEQIDAVLARAID